MFSGKGEYLGKTVQVIPHITDCLQEWIMEVAHISVDGLAGPPDICLIELGGTDQFHFQKKKTNFTPKRK